MARENLGKVITLPASGDLSAKQYHFARINTSAQLAVAGNNEDAIGVLQNDVDALGKEATACLTGSITKVKAGAVTTIGAYASCDATGRCIDAASGDFALGVILEAAGAADEIIAILFQPLGKVW